jgi:ketosteroid isomerase-like protein
VAALSEQENFMSRSKDNQMTDEDRKAVVLDYFRRIDRGEEILTLFDENAEVYFPKWGVARGLADIERLFSDLGTQFMSISHTPEYLNIVVDGDTVAGEGMTSGVATGGLPWRAGQTLAGRFCNIFEVRDFMIERCFIYLDPDYAGADTTRYPWLADEGKR